ncbi:TMEM43 family protein [Patescibacteria group bacterium]
MAQQNFGNKLVGSIGKLLFGILIFLASFVLLFMSEGRINYATVAENAIHVDQALSNKDFVYVTSDLDTPTFLGDDLYLYEDEYLVVDRTVEMFSWVEEVETEENEKVYYYDMKWVEDVPDSEEFREYRGHENPAKAVSSNRFKVDEASVGIYKLDMDEIRLLGTKSLKLNEENLTLDGYQEIISDENYDYVFDGYGSYDDPELGDIRIRYSVLEPVEEVTVFGRVADEKLGPHHGEKEKGLYRVFDGMKEDAQATLKGEYKAAGWFGRIGVFFLMWIGLMMMLSPLSVSMELIPFLGQLGKGAISLIAFIVALVLTIVASTMFAIFHSTLGLILMAGAVILVAFYFYNKSQQKPAVKK